MKRIVGEDHAHAAEAGITVPLAGEVSQGGAIDRSSAGEPVVIQRSKIDPRELLFRMESGIRDLGIDAGDLLIVEPRNRGHAATSELVMVTVHDRVFIGRWWNKRGRRALLDSAFAVIAEDTAMRILGAITLIVRPASQSRQRPKR